MDKINFVDLRKQYAELDFSDMEEIFKSGHFVGGPKLDEFHDAAAAYLGADCVGVGSGTDALILALRALGIGPGDEVIVPANTFIATAIAVDHVGATVVFADVEPMWYNISASTVSKVITDKTKAIICVHLYGRVCDLYELKDLAKEHDLFLIEDAAQAFGAEYNGQKAGTIGDVGCVSFYPAKNLGACGQGGLVISKNPHVLEYVESCSNLGRTEDNRYVHDILGYNSRLDSISAAFLTKCLTKIDKWNKLRINNAYLYKQYLSDSWVMTPSPSAFSMRHVYHLYEIDCGSDSLRDELQAYLTKNNVMCGLHYPVPCHKQPYYKKYNHQVLPVSEWLSKRLLSLPMHPYLTKDEIVRVCELINNFGKE